MATRTALIAGCLIGALSATAPAARAAVPRAGAWDSRDPIPPIAGRVATVTFDVRGPTSRRIVQRVAVPGWCPADPEPTGVVFDDVFARVRADGRFATAGDGFVLRGRFVAPDRAQVRVHTDLGECTGTRRYLVRRIRPRVPARTGRYLALVSGGTVTLEFEVDAFGREVMVEFLRGSVTASCSDGTQRALSVVGRDPLINAPIGPAGRFEATATAPPSVGLSGTFDHGSVAALLNVADVMPDGVSCRARGIPVVGALAYPF
jgi:hypothetical protein